MIRKFNSADINEIMKIWLDSNIDVHNFISEKYWNENYDSVKESIINAEVYVYVDEKSNEILGFIGLIVTYVAGLFVKDKARSQGIGKALLDYVKNFKSNLILDVYEKNAGAIQFYKKENFTIKQQAVDGDTNERECRMEWSNN